MMLLIPNKKEGWPGPAEHPTFMFKAPAFEKMIIHLRSDTSVEGGGFLLGKSTSINFEISEFIAARFVIATKSSLQFTAQTWNDYDDQKTEKFPDLELLGWAHTHPGLGVFLSNRDKTVNLFFDHIAVVYDPLQREIGFFYLRHSQQPLIPTEIVGKPKIKLDFKNYDIKKVNTSRNIKQ